MARTIGLWLAASNNTSLGRRAVELACRGTTHELEILLRLIRSRGNLALVRSQVASEDRLREDVKSDQIDQ